MERIKIDDGSKTYEIVNLDDKVLGTFTFNPSDANLVKRYKELVRRAEELAERYKEGVSTDEEFAQLQDDLVKMMDDFVGADTSSTFFSVCGAFSPMTNGNVFILTVLEAIGAIIEKETKKRIKKMDTQVNKYIGDYK